jgi:hypothetical protein
MPPSWTGWRIAEGSEPLQGGPRPSRRERGATALFLLAAFGAVHWSYRALGTTFDDTPLPWFWQYLDVPLLENRLVESLLYLHSQPPLFNLMLGVVLKLFPAGHSVAFHALFVAFGLVLYGSLFLLMRRLGVGSVTALLLSVLFVASPSFVLYESWLTYTFPVAAALVLSALLLDGLLRGRRASAAGFVLCLLFLCGTWALFHLLYFVLVIGALAALAPARRSLLLWAALPVLVALLGLYAKNLVLFGHFAPSTWLGMNLARITLQRSPAGDRRRLAAAGEISRVGVLRPFQVLSAYPPRYARVPGFEEVPCLRAPLKESGAPNLNHLGYVPLSERYLRDSLALVRLDPSIYARGLAEAWLRYFASTSDLGHLVANVDRLESPIRWWDTLVYWRLPVEVPFGRNGRLPLYLGLLAGLPVVVVVSLRLSSRPASRGLSPESRLLVGYLCFNILWVALVGNSIEVGENNRFRFTTDPLSTALLGLMIQHFRPATLRSQATDPGGAGPGGRRPRRGGRRDRSRGPWGRGDPGPGPVWR